MSRLSDLLREGGTEAAGQLDATSQLLLGLVKQPVAGLTGASYGIADLLRGKGTDAALQSAVDQIERVNAWGGPVTERGQQRLGELGQTMGNIEEKVGGALGHPIDKLGETQPALAAGALGLMDVAGPGKGSMGAAKRAATGAISKAKATANALRGERGVITPKVEPITFDITTPEGAAAFEAREGRKPVHLMDEAERVKHFGAGAAETPVVPMSDIRSRRELHIPGGLGPDAPPMTLADQAKISAQGIDYNELDPKLALDLHKRLVQSVDPGANPGDLEMMNRLGFGITSGNAPITKNLIEWAQMRPRNEAELGEWGRYSPVGIGEQMPAGTGNAFNSRINEAYGVQAGERGGTGVANTANRQYVSDLASMLREKPDYFRKQPGEPDYQYVERLINQVRGLGPKTGSLGFAMVEPQTTNISAIDRHIADLTREKVSNNPATADIYEQQMLNAYNRDKPPEAKFSEIGPARIEAGEAGPGIESSHFRDIVSSPQTRVYKDAKTGQPRADLPAHLRNLPFYEPKQSAEIGPIYNAALKQIEEGGKPRGIGGFSNQWYDWDYQRSRAEPHAAMNPMATEMPRLKPEEYKQVRDTFSQAGAMRTAKEPDTGRLRGLSPTDDWRKLLYWTAPGALTTGAMVDALREKEPEGGS
jgi:hypothetical protein